MNRKLKTLFDWVGEMNRLKPNALNKKQIKSTWKITVNS